MARLTLAYLLVLPSFFCLAQKTQTLKASEISKLLPSRIKGYAIQGESKSNVLTIGSLRYSVSERIFSSRHKRVKILLFDYVEAPIMFNQSVKRWNDLPDINTDSISFKSTLNEFGYRWHSSHPQAKRSQIIQTIHNRFVLTLEADKMSIDELHDFFQNIDFTKFPH